ncbi:molybdopterin-guanine dinucleotide biosynthesis protein MobC [Escherichia coli]|nr:molybdopterin-guanine dinucleotide biosynthesis protein MobC [Escherichia coli]
MFSDDDIEAARLALPDLTAKRKTLHDFLSAIRDDIIVLVRTKGYTLADTRSTLKEAGYEVGEKTTSPHAESQDKVKISSAQ